jgi:hypothetical protein
MEKCGVFFAVRAVTSDDISRERRSQPSYHTCLVLIMGNLSNNTNIVFWNARGISNKKVTIFQLFRIQQHPHNIIKRNTSKTVNKI